jgi:predicted RNase H-like nuclease
MNDALAAVGIDGCRAGWVAASWDSDGTLCFTVCPDFSAVLSIWPGERIAIDIPIGLPDTGSRDCDSLARALLGPRRNSVFPAPLRCMLTAATHAQACAAGRAVHGKGLSIEAFNILGKIREVDYLMTPDLRGRVVEMHPELGFWALNGRCPLPVSKKSIEGRERRLALLRPRFPAIEERVTQFRAPGVAMDDLLDACAALLTARRLVAGDAERLPASPPVDSHGLRMEIWY